MLLGRSMFVPDYKCNHCSLLNTVIATVLLIHGSFGQDIAAPDDNLIRISSRQYLPLPYTTTNDGIPVTTPLPQIKCGANMTLRESDDGHKYCECLSGYVYHSETDACYLVHTRGPCDNGHHFIVQPETMMAGCEPDPCKTDDEVFFKGSCYDLLLSDGPCGPGEFLTISEETYQPVCEHHPPIAYLFVEVPAIPCPENERLGRGRCQSEY